MVDDSVVDDGLPWLGDRIREIRIERQLPLSEVARRARISRSYLYELEGREPAERPAPTAGVLYRLAQVLGVSVADLIEPEPRRAADLRDEDIPAGLADAGKKLGLTRSEVRHLATIRFRGRQPQSAERWRLLIHQLELSQALDDLEEKHETERRDR
jgi:transcriptional regulator with XRE-family HTH domain